MQSRKLSHCVKQKSSDFASCCQVLCAEISQTHLIHIYQVASVQCYHKKEINPMFQSCLHSLSLW